MKLISVILYSYNPDSFHLMCEITEVTREHIIAHYAFLFLLLQMPESYNHMDPTIVGNSMRSVVSELSGRGNILDKVRYQ